MALPCPSINPLNSLMRKRSALELQDKQIARITPNNAINTIYHHDLDIAHIDLWRFQGRKGKGMTISLQQKQYLTRHAPMIIERWQSPSSHPRAPIQ